MDIKQKGINILVKTALWPFGQGLTIIEAAKDLNIGYKAAKYRLKRFKELYPDAWDEFERLRDFARKDKDRLRWSGRYKRRDGLKLFSEFGGKNVDYWDFLERLEESEKIKGFL